MSKMFFSKWLSTILLLCLCVRAAHGQSADPPVIKVLNGIEDKIAVNAEITVQDDKYFDAGQRALLKPNYRVVNTVSFEFDEGFPLYMPGIGDTAIIEIDVWKTGADTTLPITPVPMTLTLTYHPTGAYTHRAVAVFEGAYRVQVVVKSMTLKHVGTAWKMWRALKVVNQLQSYPAYTFSYTGNQVAALSDSAAWLGGGDKDELPVWWTPSTGADEYDLEWAYIDSAALAAGRYGSAVSPNLELVFAHNATRVTIPATAYRIPLIYDSKGHLFYRVRAVQQQAGGGRYEAKWTVFNTAGQGRFDFDGHERTLNWQATTSFAEEGKRKSVVQYYDGSLRGRQTVTKDNSTNRTVVAESFYDYQGRPVIQVLPAPTVNTIIGYTQNFNRGVNLPEYDKNRFDSLGSAGEYCTAQAAPMDSVSGASQYYSSLSAFKDSGIHKYVPNAGGFPFTEVEYTQDNTGRVSRQGGVGPDFRLGSGHETKYYYATPDQRELDALFGTEVGDKSHYFKNAVRDANGQYSISYVDMRGRTVATALAGNPDSALQKLSSNAPATRTETIADPYSVVIKDLVMEHKKSLHVTTAGNRTFDYQLNPLLLKEAGCNMDSVCYDCLYDLRITITDDCNNQKFAFDTVVRNFSINAIDTVCNNGSGFSFTFNKWMPEGNYEITKSLSVSRYALDYYRDSIYMAANKCKSIDSFIVMTRALQAQLATDCKPSCAGCKASLGSWPEYRTRFRQTTGIDGVDTAAYDGMALAAYNEAFQQCAELCDSLSEVLSVRRSMLMDMTPSSGQYANIDNPGDRYSIFYSRIDSSDDNRIKDTLPIYSLLTNYVDELGNPDLVFDEGAGKLAPPQNLSAEVFARRFKASWAEALLEKHPEYCKLVRYEQLAASHEWDRQFEAVDTYAEAKQKGYLNPTSETGSIATYFDRNTDGTDPLYDLKGTFFHKLRDSLNKYRKLDGQDVSLWSVATLAIMCPGQSTSPACINAYNTNAEAFNTTTMCAGELDMAWRSFRQLYLNVKRSLVNKWVKDSCETSGDAMTSAEIMASGHTPHFVDAQEMQALQPPSEMPTSEAETNALLEQYYADNCKAYATLWIANLASCTQYDTAALNNVIIPALVAICREGSDLSHPYGSSSVKPTSTSAPQYRSFEAYLKYYNATHSINDSLNCNAYGITAPKPYDQQEMHGNKPLYSKPDTCECANITRLYDQYKPKVGRYGSFSNYLREVYQTYAEDSVLTTLLSLCGHADFAAADCDFISQRVFLPPVFQCYTNAVCVDCDRFRQLDAEFKQRFPAARPVMTDTLITNATQLAWNRVYEQFMNYRLGYAKTAGEYLLFKNQCNGTVYNAVCDSLQDILADFNQERQSGLGVSTLLYSPPGTYFTNLPDIVHNGVVQLPDSIRQNVAGNASFSVTLNGGKHFCASNGGYSFEFRMKFLQNYPSGHIFYAGGVGLIGTFTRNGSGIYLTGVDSDNGRWGYDFDHNWASSWLASANPAVVGDWFTVKMKLTASKYRFYFNGTLFAEFDRNPATTIQDVTNLALTYYSKHGAIDWVKVYDHNDQLKYFEDYTDPSNPALPNPDFLCPPTSTDCTADFVDYFNDRTGGSYTYHQIDSIYGNSCALPLAVCGAPGSNSDTLTNWLNDYKKYGGVPHLDASGADTTHFKVNFGGPSYTAGVPLGATINNGIWKLPDYYTDTLPDTGPTRGVDFDRVKDTLCLDSAGFTFETRLRLPDSEVHSNIYNDSWWLVLYSDPGTSGNLLVSLKLTPDRGGAICTHQSDPNVNCVEEHVPHLPMDVWRKIRLQFRGRQFRFYIDSMLVGTRTLDAPMTRLYWWTLHQFSQRGEVDYIRITDVNGRYLYNEEFEDAQQLAVTDRSLKCGGCELDYTKYFNSRNGSSLTYGQIAGLYAQRGITLDACSKADLTLCGR
ncbi:MAG: hypothetical protein J7621_28180, partial [Niastella sp.]|nr:hypothetical protein [Niastella sp.]